MLSSLNWANTAVLTERTLKYLAILNFVVIENSNTSDLIKTHFFMVSKLSHL